MALTVRRVPQTGRGFIEPLLDVGDAIPLHMVRIPGGTFTMGSPEDEPEREENEGPQHKVTVPLFFLGRYPVTQAQYERLMKTNPAKQYDVDRLAPNKPVVGVSWEDTVAFCDRLSTLTERIYRLPSEAEWEYACRAGTTTPFHFGQTLTPEVANYDSTVTYGNGTTGKSRGELTPVDHFSHANAFGLSDMHGNVWEWCADHWHGNYEGAPSDGRAWIEDGDSTLRIFRGGSWCSLPRLCRSAYRLNSWPDFRLNHIGFRVVCSAPRPLL